MAKYEASELANEGKTKRVKKVVGKEKLVIIENKTDITAHDNPDFTKNFASKASCATITTSRVFEMLNARGVPTAFVEQISETEFVARKCTMIPLEIVVRRYAVGSYLKRRPDLTQEPPLRFDNLVVEFFLKTTGGKVVYDGKVVAEGISEEDPLIENPFGEEWRLLHPKKPKSDPKHDLGRTVKMTDILPFATEKDIIYLLKMAINTFLFLEGGFERINVKLIDFKIEGGVEEETGEVVVGDVIDNDSWRIRDENWQELSKERFRQGEALEIVEQLYQLVAMLVSKSEFFGEAA